MRRPASLGGGLLLACLCLPQPATAQQAAPPDNAATMAELPTVLVIGTTPLTGLGTPLEHTPANAQSATAAQIDASQTISVADFLRSSLNGVAINDASNNPFQPDVLFRGFTASPLLGTPQGISVYQDGVRINEPFGDVVNWDLIPQSAISTMTLIPGSNPAFGLNTLGGALSIQTKSGFQYPGIAGEAYGGSFGRRSAQLEAGGSKGRFDYFAAGEYFEEDGWRDNSPSEVGQLFGKLGWENELSDVDVSYVHAETDLAGNGFTPQGMLGVRREAVFTPDTAANQLDFVNAKGSHFLSEQLLLSGNTYYRRTDARTFNGDINDEYEDAYEALLEPGGDCTDAPDPEACAAGALADATASNNRTHTVQDGYGATLQLTSTQALLGRRNQLTAGLSYDGSRSDFRQTEQEAAFTPERVTVASEEEELDTSFVGRTGNYGVYATDTWSIAEDWHLTAALRYNRTRVQLSDRLGTALNGDHRFERLNPALGLNYAPRESLTLYGSYNEGSRAPSAIELGCADPETPCKLPNAFAADPPLDQVVARTFETGARGRLGFGGLRWSAAVFHTVNDNDIQFISSQVSGAGFFDNVGRTRRYGGEMALEGRWRDLSWRAGYALVEASYRSAISVVSEDNSAADEGGVIAVQPGDAIPGIPRHSFKLGGDWALTPAWSVGAALTAFSEQYARGNQNNEHQAGVNDEGEEFLGPGVIGGYTVVDLTTRWGFARGWELFARLANLFDQEYATAGVLGANPFGSGQPFAADPEAWSHETFYGPGAPRAAWVGLRYAWGRSKTPVADD